MESKALRRRKPVRTVAVASGKGGVGRTCVVVNLAIAIQKSGRKVMILDADLGLSNVDVLLGLAPRYTIRHVLTGEKTIREVLAEGPHGVKILSAVSGVQELTALDEFQRLKILDEFEAYDEELDLLLIDTPPGISENVAFFCIGAQQNILVTQPEPTAIADAWALMRVLYAGYQERSFSLLVNSAESETEALDVFRRLSAAVSGFPDMSLDYMGHIPFDESVGKAVRAQKAFVEMYPECEASKMICELGERIMSAERRTKGTLQFFIGDLYLAHARH